MRAQNQGHHTIDRLEGRGAEREERERAIVNQTNVVTVSKATLEKVLRDGVKRIRGLPSA